MASVTAGSATVAIAAADDGGGGANVPIARTIPAQAAAPALSPERKRKLCVGFCGAAIFLICVLVPASLEKVSSTEVGYAYDAVWAELGTEQLGEGLKSIPTFGYVVKWPTSNQAVDLSCQCNSHDAIVVDISCDFLYVPMAAKTLELTKKFKDFEEYDKIVTLTARSSVRNACGDFTALEFQTMRDSVQIQMEKKVSDDLRAMLQAEVLTLNLRNIERPVAYQEAVNLREAARADIDLAIFQRKQQLVMANTKLQSASLNANKTLNTARTMANVKIAFAEAAYNGTLDRYETYANVLRHAKEQHSLSTRGVLAWHGNEIVQSSDHVAVHSPAKFSYRDEL